MYESTLRAAIEEIARQPIPERQLKILFASQLARTKVTLHHDVRGYFISDARLVDADYQIGQSAIIVDDIHSTTDRDTMSTALHEAAHFFDQGYSVQLPFTANDREERQAVRQFTSELSAPVTRLEIEEPASEFHNARWMRINIHLAERGRERWGTTPAASLSLEPISPHFRPLQIYVDALGTEVRRLWDMPISQVIETEPPQRFVMEWQDVIEKETRSIQETLDHAEKTKRYA